MLLRILGANRMEDFLVAGNEIVSSYHYSFFSTFFSLNFLSASVLIKLLNI